MTIVIPVALADFILGAGVALAIALILRRGGYRP